MNQPTARLFIILLISLLLSACASWNSASNTKKAICNKLKSDIVFSGATSDTRQADVEKAERPLEQKNYDQNNC